jgi:RNA polymerase sigma-70 factor (ECF subfamily)
VIFRDARVSLGAHSPFIATEGRTMQAQTPAQTVALNPIECAVDGAQLHPHRAYLLRVARNKLRDPVLAEDAVQDVFEAVLAGRARFGGRSALRTWLAGILLHKVTDLQRQGMRYCALDATSDDEDDGGYGHDTACDGPRPDESAEQRELLARALACVERLPTALRDVMWRRAIHDEPTETVCSQLGITPDAMFVRLHRARRQIEAAVLC